jgi:hypothetical protein
MPVALRLSHDLSPKSRSAPGRNDSGGAAKAKPLAMEVYRSKSTRSHPNRVGAIHFKNILGGMTRIFGNKSAGDSENEKKD